MPVRSPGYMHIFILSLFRISACSHLWNARSAVKKHYRHHRKCAMKMLSPVEKARGNIVARYIIVLCSNIIYCLRFSLSPSHHPLTHRPLSNKSTLSKVAPFFFFSFLCPHIFARRWFHVVTSVASLCLREFAASNGPLVVDEDLPEDAAAMVARTERALAGAAPAVETLEYAQMANYFSPHR